MPDASNNRTILQAAVTQGAAGQLDIVAAQPGCRIYVVGFALSATGVATVQFNEGVAPTVLTGALPLVAGVPISEFGDDTPVFATNTVNSKLGLLSVTLPVFGWLRYFIAA